MMKAQSMDGSFLTRESRAEAIRTRLQRAEAEISEREMRHYNAVLEETVRQRTCELELANARDADAFDRAIDLRIMRIRRKIEPDPSHPSVIRTVRGGGYLFSPAGET